MGRYFTPLVPDGLGSAGCDEFVMPQPSREIDQDLQVAAGLAGWGEKLGSQFVAPFSLARYTLFLYPQSGRQYYLCMALRLAIFESIRDHGEAFFHGRVIPTGGRK